MTRIPDHLTPEIWLAQFLDSAEARRGGVVKRQIRDVERLVGREMFLRAVERRGFQAVENGRHYVVFCNGQPIRRLRGPGPRDFEIPWPSRLQAAWHAVSKPR
ncbi:hypothetical protein SAMN05443999_10961 [Roseovarius azorensis]|uniref:N-(5'-phosphoribosyl)anthranilate isomerase n=1 Tax=Roseovarius azorensis TaxID=1287727 RepID=A0A1H7TWP7_9RHOB|nr:N-(5'-phosphoribosyl)anthranilate isomerase [Roseovarius azorensis]SEL88836.1 hypothetical protein SAMN05443999_10961 [Roseovarius azorensis]